MGNLSGFNANDHEPGRDFDPLPNGKYLAEIVESEQKDIGNNGSSGWKFVFTWKIKTGPFEGRLIWQDILSGYNATGEKADKTRNIAASNIADISRAVGKITPDDTSDFHYIPCEITVGLQKQQNDNNGNPYPPRNEVKGVKPANGNSGAGANQRQQQPNQSRFQPQQNSSQNTGAQQGGSSPPARSSNAPSGGGWQRPSR